jgi:hypothetical protein
MPMTAARKFDSIDSGAGELPARLRPTDSHLQRAIQAAGPFEITGDDGKTPTMRDALVTGLLVIYPAFATVAAIIAGLILAGASGT